MITKNKKNPTKIKHRVTNKSPTRMSIVKLVEKQFGLNVKKRQILKFLVRSISEKVLSWN